MCFFYLLTIQSLIGICSYISTEVLFFNCTIICFHFPVIPEDLFIGVTSEFVGHQPQISSKRKMANATLDGDGQTQKVVSLPSLYVSNSTLDI